MILPHSRVKINGEIVWVETVDVLDQKNIKLNGTSTFERVPLTEKDLEFLTLPFEEVDLVRDNRIPYLHSGKYKVTYNQEYYFMTYLDELDLFRRVVYQRHYKQDSLYPQITDIKDWSQEKADPITYYTKATFKNKKPTFLLGDI